ncbi:OTU domain-containing protein, partial [Stylophora pistillata]
MSLPSEATCDAISHTLTRDIERRERKCIIGTCGIWKPIHGQGGKFVGTGSLVKGFFLKCDKIIHLITSDKVITSHDLSDYYLHFKKSKGKDKEPKKLVSIVCDEVIFKSGLAIVPVDPNKFGIIRKHSSGLLMYRPFTIRSEVKEDLRNFELYCHVVEPCADSFAIRPYQVMGIAEEETYVADHNSKIKSASIFDIYGKGLGAPISFTFKDEAVAVGALTMKENGQISFVLFSQIDRTRKFADERLGGGENQQRPGQPAEGGEQQPPGQQALKGERQINCSEQGGGTFTSRNSSDARQQEALNHLVDQDTSTQDAKRVCSANILRKIVPNRSSVIAEASLQERLMLLSSVLIWVSRPCMSDAAKVTFVSSAYILGEPRLKQFGYVELIAHLQQMQLDASKVNDKTDKKDLRIELNKIASDNGFRIVDNEGSGNCMFYALSDQLEIAMRIKIKHDELRQILVQYLRENPKLPNGTNLFHFVHQSWADYLTYMKKDGAWGDHVILWAAANRYKTCIRVISSLGATHDVILRPQCPVDKSRTLVLGHIHEVHYVSLHSTQGENKMPIYQCATGINNGEAASENGMVIKEQQKLERNLTDDSKHSLQSNQGHLSPNLLRNGCYVISIEPSTTPLKGGGPCWFTFKPDLPSDFTSGTAGFASLGSIDVYKLEKKTNVLVGRGIPATDKEGWVIVEVSGKSDKTGKSSDLGQTKIYYYDEDKKALKRIVAERKQSSAFFEEWKTACEGHSTDSKEKETKSPCSGSMDSGNPLYSLQGLLLLVYTAAETDARQFIALVFNSSAGRVVFNAYRSTTPLPENVARAFGHEDTAHYLESISERLSKDFSVNEEHLQSSHILELADAVKNPSNDNHEENRFPMELEEQDQSAKTTEEENGSVFTNKVGT